MSGEFTNIEGVLAEAQNQNYYDLLIKQLSKDLMRVGVVQVSEMPCAPIDLKVWLENVLLELIKYDFDSYLQLLYVVMFLRKRCVILLHHYLKRWWKMSCFLF